MEDNCCFDESFDFEDYRPFFCLDQSRFLYWKSLSNIIAIIFMVSKNQKKEIQKKLRVMMF